MLKGQGDLRNNLKLLMNSADSAIQRAALREASAYLMRSNKRRIKSNREPDGNRMQRRKHSNERMFQKLAKHMQRRTSENGASIGFYGRTGKIASDHQSGNTVSHARYEIELPHRILMGISREDEQAVADIFLKHLSAVFS